MSLLELPAETQKEILLSLDYASLCLIRSTGRYFYNLLTEPEIHEVFLNIDVPKGELTSYPERGDGTCSYCAVYCEATAVQKMNTKAGLELAEKEVNDAKERLTTAKDGLVDAKNALRKARSTTKKTTKASKEEKISEAKEEVKLAKEALNAAHDDVLSADNARARVLSASPDNARQCYVCKRQHNGYTAPGYLDINDDEVIKSSWGWQGASKSCSRTTHFLPNTSGNRYMYPRQVVTLQLDGKICKICWKSTGRGASGIARRRTFVEEHGYWLREKWLEQGILIKARAEMLTHKTLKDIEEEAEVGATIARFVKTKSAACVEKV
jgi:hypothetical protein